MTTRKRKIVWRDTEPTSTGNKQWISLDGMFRLVCVDRYNDIPIATVWVLWLAKGDDWTKLWEGRSKAKAIKQAQLRYDKWDNDEE